jgi:hypothetical protein
MCCPELIPKLGGALVFLVPKYKLAATTTTAPIMKGSLLFKMPPVRPEELYCPLLTGYPLSTQSAPKLLSM